MNIFNQYTVCPINSAPFWYHEKELLLIKCPAWSRTQYKLIRWQFFWIRIRGLSKNMTFAEGIFIFYTFDNIHWEKLILIENYCPIFNFTYLPRKNRFCVIFQNLFSATNFSLLNYQCYTLRNFFCGHHLLYWWNSEVWRKSQCSMVVILISDNRSTSGG